MLEFKTDEELKRWPDFCRCSFSKEKEEKEPLVELLRASTPTSPMMLLLMLGEKEKALGLLSSVQRNHTVGEARGAAQLGAFG